MTNESSVSENTEAALFHLRLGWTLLFLFMALGVALEAMHGLKIGFYLNDSNEARRLLWTLAHAHGALFSIINLAFAFSLRVFPEIVGDWVPMSSKCLLAGSILVPAGFFVGGAMLHAGDPGLGIALVPVGALLMLIVIYRVAMASRLR